MASSAYQRAVITRTIFHKVNTDLMDHINHGMQLSVQSPGVFWLFLFEKKKERKKKKRSV